MLNMNSYDNRSKRGGRFTYGALLELGSIGVNRYENGEIRGRIHFLTLVSSGTGHWPFTVFEFSWLTGIKKALHVTLLGLCFGFCTRNDIDENGMINGPDTIKFYSYFSCINHQHKTLEEII